VDATSTITNGDTNYLASADAIYDFVTGQGYLNSLSGALLATGSVTGATSQAQTFTNGIISSATSTFATVLGIKEGGGTPTYYTYFTGGDQSADITYTLPTALPGSNKVLQSTSGGVLSWEEAGGASLWTATSTGAYYSGGNVGIGTASPGYALDVNGTFNATATSTFSGNVGIGTAAPGKKLDVLQAASASQLRVSQTAAVYSEFYLDSTGDLRISATGGDIRALDENLWVCAGNGCRDGITASGNGNLIVEGGVTVGTSAATCDASKRGTIRIEEGGAGVTDKLWACLKTSADAYNWVLTARGD
jgi:hypothetical protein